MDGAPMVVSALLARIFRIFIRRKPDDHAISNHSSSSSSSSRGGQGRGDHLYEVNDIHDYLPTTAERLLFYMIYFLGAAVFSEGASNAELRLALLVITLLGLDNIEYVTSLAEMQREASTARRPPPVRPATPRPRALACARTHVGCLFLLLSPHTGSYFRPFWSHVLC
jgi:hypothetical protein